MALAESSCERTDDTAATLKSVKTYLDPGTGDHIQAIAIDDDSGNQLGVAGNPFPTEEQEAPPTDASKFNPSQVLTYVAGDLTQIDQVVGGTTYRRTLTYVAGDLTAISTWAAI